MFNIASLLKKLKMPPINQVILIIIFADFIITTGGALIAPVLALFVVQNVVVPHVSGAAALVLTTQILSAYDANLNGLWEPSEVQNKLQATAKDLGDSGHDSLYGWGLVDAAAAVK